jgi:hypothetical protein
MSQSTTFTCTNLSTTVFTRYDDTQPGKVVYHAADHTDQVRHKLELFRSEPKKTTSTFGARKSRMKITRDILVDKPSGETGYEAQITEHSMRIPASAETADLAPVQLEVVDLLAGDADYSWTTHMKSGVQ